MWLDITAQPLRQDKYVFQKDDWRTWHRLMLYRFIAMKEILGQSVCIFVLTFLVIIILMMQLFGLITFVFFLQHRNQKSSKYPGVRKMAYIPAFFSTICLSDKMCDYAHYSTDAKIPQVQQLLHSISTHEAAKAQSDLIMKLKKTSKKKEPHQRI